MLINFMKSDYQKIIERNSKLEEENIRQYSKIKMLEKEVEWFKRENQKLTKKNEELILLLREYIDKHNEKLH